MRTRLEQNGFHCVIPDSCFERDCLGNAGSPRTRAEVFNNLIGQSEIDAVLSFWGGQDTIEILPYIDFERFVTNPRWVCGYSDAGILIQAISERTGMPTLYGLAGVTLSKRFYHEVSWNSFYHLAARLEAYTPPVVVKNIASDASVEISLSSKPRVFREGRASGRSLVSSIAALCALLGTPYCPDFSGRVLFLELSEDFSATQFCRFLAQLSLSGALAEIRGVAFSKFMDDSEITEEVIDYVCSNYLKDDIPILLEMDFGHTDPIVTLPNFADVTIDTSSDSPITFSRL
jgi:muramoyltetrapeptide carboxypeptidase LdcA involved in peptidoglycan recycling